MFRGCIFDLDGTLANTLQSIAYFGNAALAELGFAPIPPDEYRRMVGNGADMLVRRMLFYVAKEYDEAAVQKLRLAYDVGYEARPLYLVTPYPGISSLLHHLLGAGVQLAVLSNKPDNMTTAIVASLFPTTTFVQVCGQRAGVPAKPDPTSALEIVKKMKLPPEEILYIGDSGVDMETGTRAGLASAGVLWGFRQRNELLENGAQFLPASAQELEKLILQP